MTGTSIERESDGGIDLGGGHVGRAVKVGVEGECELILQAIDLEGAEGFVGHDLRALSFPLWRGPEAAGGLLESVKQQPSAAVVDAVIGDGVDHLLDAGLDGVHVVEDGHLETARVAVDTRAGGLDAAGANVEVKEAVTLVAKSGGTAVDAIFFEMVTGTVGHKAS